MALMKIVYGNWLINSVEHNLHGSLTVNKFIAVARVALDLSCVCVYACGVGGGARSSPAWSL